MDYRLPLKQHSVLLFDGMQCHVQELIGCGSNAMVYKGWYPDVLNPELVHHVLVKELFPYHPKGRIYRDENDWIVAEPDASDLFAVHRESFLLGNEIHLRLLADHPDRLGANLNSFSYRGTLYSVLGYNGGRSLGQELSAHTPSLRGCALRMMRLLDALEAFHQSGYLHLDISPDNIMVLGAEHQERIFLIDYNSARPISGGAGTYSSCKPGYSAPEVESGDGRTIGIPSDLYSVAAVFFRMLMGRSLTLEETLRPKAPDGGESPLLTQAPQTVSGFVGTILRKGLHTLPRKRYQSISQMRRAFSELLDRIDAVGVTHWALWESGRRLIEERTRANPALAYLKNAERLYPIRLEQERQTLDLPMWLDRLASPEGQSAVLLGEGGMGKSTLLMRCALMLSNRYTPTAPAAIYLPLGGWSGSGGDEIRKRILINLRFKAEENTWSDAMHRLHGLMSEPLRGKNGPCPSVILLLDGVNEIASSPEPLLEEIRMLAAMPGVRVVVSSRTPIESLALPMLRMAPLEESDVAFALGKAGLLIAQQEMMVLLRTPLILSLYLLAGEAGKKGQIRNQSQLMDAYLHALYHKAAAPLPEDSPLRWQMDAALHYVLPCAAAAEKRASGALSQPELLKIVTSCWRFLHTGRMKRAFPQWIGRSRDIFGEAENPEQWYALMIHRLLWQEFAMLIREPNGGSRIYHQMLRDHLAQADCTRISQRETLRQWAVVLTAVVTAGAMTLCLPGLGQYDDRSAELAVDYSACAYTAFGTMYDRLRALADAALTGDSDTFASLYDRCLGELTVEAAWTDTEEVYLSHISGEMEPHPEKTVSWSGKHFDSALSAQLIGYPTERASYYARTIPMLAQWMASEQLQKDSPGFAQAFSRVVEADADLVAELYHQTCGIHMENGDPVWMENVHSLVEEISALEKHRVLDALEDRDQYLANLRQTLSEAQRELVQQSAAIRYTMEESQ